MRYMPSKDFGGGLDRLYTLIGEDHTPPGTDDLPAAFAYAALLHVVDMAHGISLLHHDGRCWVVPPLMRSLLEYTMGAMWLAEARSNAVAVLMRGAQGAGGKLLRDVTDAGRTLEDYWGAELAGDFREGLAFPLPPHSDEYLSRFSHLLKAYGFDELVAEYDVLSTHSHLSLFGLLRGLSFLPPGVSEQISGEVDCERRTFQMAFEAASAVDGLLAGSPWSAGLASIRTDYDLLPSEPQRRSRPSTKNGKMAKGSSAS